MQQTLKNPVNGDKLKPTEYVGYALGDTASNLFFQTFGIFLTYYYTDVWGLAAASIPMMMLIVRLFDAATDPLVGMMADRTQTRWGKFRPYVLWSAVPYGLCGYLLFLSPNLDQSGKLVYAYISYSLMMLAYTFVNVPYSSMLGVISPSPKIRTLASSYRFVGAFGGGLLVTLFVRPLVKYLGGGVDAAGKTINELRGFQLTMLIFAVVSVIMFFICFATTKERVTPPADQKPNAKAELKDLIRNYPWLMLVFSAIFSLTFIGLRNGSAIYYFKYVANYDSTPILFGQLDRLSVFLSLGMLAQMAGSLCLSFFAKVADKRIISVLLSLGTAISWASFYFIPKDAYALQLVVQVIGTFFMGPASALVWAMYADVADYGEWKFGRRATGLVYSASLFALKTGTALAGFLLPWILAKYGFIPNVAQTPTAILGITLSFSLFPAVFASFKALMLWLYPLDKAKVDEIEHALAARRAAAAAA
jgi:GPH family glycoside/pentoside/hexuronide:cation symporter